jgi:hypothetical protein
MYNLLTHRYCDVIGCRRAAVVTYMGAGNEINEEALCASCYRNLSICRPDLAPAYRPMLTADSLEERSTPVRVSVAG